MQKIQEGCKWNTRNESWLESKNGPASREGIFGENYTKSENRFTEVARPGVAKAAIKSISFHKHRKS